MSCIASVTYYGECVKLKTHNQNSRWLGDTLRHLSEFHVPSSTLSAYVNLHHCESSFNLVLVFMLRRDYSSHAFVHEERPKS